MPKTFKPRLPRAKQYDLLKSCLEVGLRGGIFRWQKHRDHVLQPEDIEDLTDLQAREILNEICERFEVS